ncbi:putative F-box/LRR-repeat protein At3g16555 [Cucurbita moschata]|uniref:F-box/LRR-repeat protein At3g16555 n=1 Tax=Cucurbita moschata TaxID=3662 RepID=A0A6J1G2T3_CUCMO|nr:putative F-box/LRR-repeat protein At3g16555 [Cucurbita moschata]
MAALLGNMQVTMEILSWLPPETLLRFKSVHKSWYALIDDPKFILKHFSNSLRHNHIFLKRNMEIASNKDKATREFRKLPPSIFPVCTITDASPRPIRYELIMHAVGFGYDANSRDFKVVRIVDIVGLRRGYPVRKAEIYDLSKDRWREIEPPVRYSEVSSMASFDMFHEGTYYWWSSEEDEEFIQSFNMSDEVFGEIPLPESLNMDKVGEIPLQESLNMDEGEEEEEEEWPEGPEGPRKMWSMGILNGSIVVLDYLWGGIDEKSFNVWEMKKEESGVWWSKLFTIGPIGGIENPLLFVSSDELLMESNKGHAILYNIKTQHIKELPIKGDENTFEATFFVKSLFSVKGGNNSTVCSPSKEEIIV